MPKCKSDDEKCAAELKKCLPMDITCKFNIIKEHRYYLFHPKERRLMRLTRLFAVAGSILAACIGEYVACHTVDKKRTMHNRLTAWMLTVLSVCMMWGFWACVYLA